MRPDERVAIRAKIAELQALVEERPKRKIVVGDYSWDGEDLRFEFTDEPSSYNDAFKRIVGSSTALRNLGQLLIAIADTRA